MFFPFLNALYTIFNCSLKFQRVFPTNILSLSLSFFSTCYIIFREFTLSNPILASTLNVISGKVTPLDLVEVVTESSVYHSFLSIGYGLIADMDIESERLRCLGGLRFALWAIIRTIGEFEMHSIVSPV